MRNKSNKLPYFINLIIKIIKIIVSVIVKVISLVISAIVDELNSIPNAKNSPKLPKSNINIPNHSKPSKSNIDIPNHSKPSKLNIDIPKHSILNSKLPQSNIDIPKHSNLNSKILQPNIESIPKLPKYQKIEYNIEEIICSDCKMDEQNNNLYKKRKNKDNTKKYNLFSSKEPHIEKKIKLSQSNDIYEEKLMLNVENINKRISQKK